MDVSYPNKTCEELGTSVAVGQLLFDEVLILLVEVLNKAAGEGILSPPIISFTYFPVVFPAPKIMGDPMIYPGLPALGRETALPIEFVAVIV